MSLKTVDVAEVSAKCLRDSSVGDRWNLSVLACNCEAAFVGVADIIEPVFVIVCTCLHLLCAYWLGRLNALAATRLNCNEMLGLF